MTQRKEIENRKAADNEQAEIFFDKADGQIKIKLGTEVYTFEEVNPFDSVFDFMYQ